VAAAGPTVRLVGGLASAGTGPGRERLVLDDDVLHDGAVAVALGPQVGVSAVVSHGCRPIGTPWVVTAAEGRLLLGLAGRPALERVNETLAGLAPHDRVLAARGLHLGVVGHEHGVVEFGPGDFVIRDVLGADPARAAVAVGDVVEVGQVVQLQVRDAVSADADLHRALAGVSGAGALLFSCNGRGSRLFGAPDHDATVVSESVAGPVAGMFCAGELGPVGTANAVHTFTASLAVFE
jgi:small ligand-binding sensory domain FIST